MIEDVAAAEKVFLAEKNVAYVRVGVIVLNSLVYLFMMERQGTVPWLAHTIIVVANLYGLTVLFYQPYRRFPVMQTAGFTAITDASLITLWLAATGSVASPFYILWYVSIVAVAFRYPYRETLWIGVGYAACYLGLLGVRGELVGHPVEAVVRTSYIFFVGAVGGLISRELMAQTRAKVQMRDLMREARLAEERFRVLLEAAPDAIVLVDRRGRILLANARTEQLFGHSEAELTGRPIGLLVPQGMGPALERAWGRGAPADGLTLELAGRRRDGTRVPCEIRLAVSTTPDGPLVTLIVRDVTERKHTEEELRARATELSRSNAELEQFAYVASHDLQEPLRMVTSYVQLLDRRYGDDLDEDARSFISFAVEGATRMQALINDLLAFSRVGSGSEHLEPTNTGEVLDQALAQLKVASAEAGAQVTHDPMPVVLAEPGHLEQLFLNLLSNAIKFRGEATPRIHVGTQRQGDTWTIRVTDNGIGIPAEYQDRIFTIFQRLHTREEYAGTGIGLAICKKIIERAGGRIWVESPADLVPGNGDGPGSSFVFTLHAVAEPRPGPRRAGRADETLPEPSDPIARRARELI